MFDLRPCSLQEIRPVVEKHHGYGSVGSSATYAFAVYEEDTPVAVFAWQPPPPGSSADVCREAPQGVLSLSRMAAVPKTERQLKHISKPLRVQMKKLIDRTRWPVLVTYSDEGQGHTGYVYQCAGFEKTIRREAPFFVDQDGRRVSSYANGRHGSRDLVRGGTTIIQRWEHWICPKEEVAVFMRAAGWRKEPIPGKRWKSGNPANRWVRDEWHGL